LTRDIWELTRVVTVAKVHGLAHHALQCGASQALLVFPWIVKNLPNKTAKEMPQ
jgi:hypothetical protein